MFFFSFFLYTFVSIETRITIQCAIRDHECLLRVSPVDPGDILK